MTDPAPGGGGEIIRKGDLFNPQINPVRQMFLLSLFTHENTEVHKS